MPEAPPEAATSRLAWNRQLGPWAIHFAADLTRAARDAPFLVTETNALSIGESHANFPAYDGQWHLAAWSLVARGARMVEYWHWHSIHFGNEMYWLGVLNHDGEPGRCYAEVQRIAGELAQAGDAVVDLVPDADVGLLYSLESKWAMEFQPAARRRGRPGARSRLLRPHRRPLLRGPVRRGRPGGRRLSPAASATTPRRSSSAGPSCSPPGSTSPSDELLDRLDAYARAGGHLVLGIRSGYADDEARARHEVMPGRLREAAGVTYSEYTNLGVPVPLTAPAAGELDLPAGATGTAWADALVPEGADTLRRLRPPAPRPLGRGHHARARRAGA